MSVSRSVIPWQEDRKRSCAGSREDQLSKERSDKLAVGDVNTSALNDIYHGVSMDNIENAMVEISNELGMEAYQRNFVECCCCESFHSQYLEKKDVFVKDCSLFELTPDGKMIEKEYGRYKEWKMKSPIERTYVYLLKE